MFSTKKKPETLWKMVEAQCAQLADAVAAARIPFFLALLWAFIWAWSLYSSDFGYLATFYRHRLDDLISYSRDTTGTPRHSQFVFDCNRVTAGGLEDTLTAPGAPSAYKDVPLTHGLRGMCEDALSKRRLWAESTYLDSTGLSFPGGFSKIEASDLGVIGQTGLILILVWQFYAMRRENHAIRTFVDLDHHTRTIGRRFAARFILQPQDKFLSAEHLAYAYHAVAQRFLFVFSRYSRPLLGITTLLTAIPAVVATLNAVSDIRDVASYDWAQALVVRLAFEIVLLVLVWYATIAIIYYIIDTGILLNGWYLASKAVWISEWDEDTADPASQVWVDREEQRAEIYTPPKDGEP